MCALFLIVCALTRDDYHMVVDHADQNLIGMAALDYLAGDGERAFDQLLSYHDRYYGPLVEAPIVLVQRSLDLRDSAARHSRYLLHHSFFLFGGICCYLLTYRLFYSRKLSLITMILFLLHPHIYVHSIINSKDPAALALFMVSLYLIHRAFRRETLGAFLLCGIGIGLVTNLRIVGIVLFAAVLSLRALDLAFAESARERKRALLTGGGVALVAILTYYATMPGLWTDPAGRFAEALGVLNAHPSAFSNLFQGEWLYGPDGPPWDYVPVWVGITTPPATLLLSLVGTTSLAWRARRRPRDILRNGPLRFGMLLLLLPVVTTAGVVVLGSNISQGWRHLFFLYAPLIGLAAFGLHWLTSFSRERWVAAGAYALAGIAVAVVIVALVRIHPYGVNSFNSLTDRTTPERLVSRYATFGWYYNARLLETTERPDASISLDRSFRSGEDAFRGVRTPWACSPPSPPGTWALRIYANTFSCIIDPEPYVDGIRSKARTGEPLLRSVFDIHRDGRHLYLSRDGCATEDVEANFVLHVFPANPDDLPGERRRHGFENLSTSLDRTAVRLDERCAAFARLPDYAIARIHTGQYDDGGALWLADVRFDGREPSQPPDYAEAQREAMAGEPLARAVFDVYLVGRALTYLRDGCTDEEAAAPFFLHVDPVVAGDLPAHRRGHGFDNLDFSLAGSGARLPDGACVAVVPLPDYPIARIHTGQYDEAGERWRAEFALPDGE